MHSPFFVKKREEYGHLSPCEPDTYQEAHRQSPCLVRADLEVGCQAEAVSALR